MTESSPPPTDPFEPMRRSYEEALDAWSKSVEQLVGTDQFADASNRLLTQYVEMQKGMRDTSRAAADALHIPTKDDIARVAELVVNVERKIDEVTRREDGLADLVERLPVEGLAAMPGRLLALEAKIESLGAAIPPSAPDPGDALAAISDRLDRLEAALTALQRKAPPTPPDPAAAVAPVLARLTAIETSLDALAAAARDGAAAPSKPEKGSSPKPDKGSPASAGSTNAGAAGSSAKPDKGSPAKPDKGSPAKPAASDDGAAAPSSKPAGTGRRARTTKS